MNKHQYICKICEVVASKSYCSKRKVGAVFASLDHEILATGYNGTPRGFPPCVDFHSPDEACLVTAHAEQNAIVQAAKRGTALLGSLLYCTYLPCPTCSRLLVNLGVKEVWYKSVNPDGGIQILQHAGIPVRLWGAIK